jgi:hypothetical protein
MIMSTVEAMRVLVEQQAKISEMMMEMVRQMKDNDALRSEETRKREVVSQEGHVGHTDAWVKEMLDAMSEDEETLSPHRTYNNASAKCTKRNVDIRYI